MSSPLYQVDRRGRDLRFVSRAGSSSPYMIPKMISQVTETAARPNCRHIPSIRAILCRNGYLSLRSKAVATKALFKQFPIGNVLLRMHLEKNVALSPYRGTSGSKVFSFPHIPLVLRSMTGALNAFPLLLRVENSALHSLDAPGAPSGFFNDDTTSFLLLLMKRP